MITLDQGVVGLTGHFGCSVGCEGAVGRGGARRECFGVEFRGSVVTDQDARLMLQRMSETGRIDDLSLGLWHLWFTQGLIAFDVRAELAWLVANCICIA